MTDEVRLDHFFSVLHEKRKAFADSYAYFAPKLAPRFNCFDFISPNENKLSKILAELLDPKGTHAQGDIFLRLFFKEINIPYPSCTNNIQVRCESRTNRIEEDKRRIDIEVDFDNSFGLAIENKPWAGDQKNQLTDYAMQMDKKFKKWCLVYLPGTDKNPSESSATPQQLEDWEKKDQYRKREFARIIEWLKKCEAQCQADHVRHFLRDFIGYCESEFLGVRDMLDADLVQDVVLKNAENVDMAFSVFQQIPAIKETLLKKLIKDLEARFNEALPNWEFKVNKNYSYASLSTNDIKFRKTGWQKYSLSINFERPGRLLIWGICKKDGTIPDLPDAEAILKELNEKLKEAGKRTQWWSWYCCFSAPYYDWEINIEPWLDIQSGTMVGMVIKKIVALAGASEAMIDEAERLATAPLATASGTTVNQAAGVNVDTKTSIEMTPNYELNAGNSNAEQNVESGEKK